MIPFRRYKWLVVAIVPLPLLLVRRLAFTGKFSQNELLGQTAANMEAHGDAEVAKITSSAAIRGR